MNKKSLIMLALLIVLGIILWLTRDLEHEEKKFDFFTIDSTSISKIEIKGNNDTLTIVKSNNKWKMNIPHEVDVRKKKIDSFFEKFL
ncbi:MAG: hypothetical protein U9N34_01480, partial [Candidatus Cloacimonadota bacterium]|nr:hypothetical protein [Candidatus Cloacimonadota bacterium]